MVRSRGRSGEHQRQGLLTHRTLEVRRKKTEVTRNNFRDYINLWRRNSNFDEGDRGRQKETEGRGRVGKESLSFYLLQMIH